MTKTIARLIDKSRPELGYVTQGAKFHSHPIEPSVAKDPSRQSVAHQLEQTMAKMKANLYQVTALTKAGRLDKAFMVCQLIATQRARFVWLQSQLIESMAQDPIIADPVARPANTTVKVKAHRYSRWSVK